MSDSQPTMLGYVQSQLSPPSATPDMTNQYNTSLDPGQEAQYQRWLQLQSALNNRDMSGDNTNYDMRGAFVSGATQAGNAHWPDTFKKPNHPTFSDQSQYNGVDGHTGGSWSQMGQRWYFSPSATNLQMHGVAGLQNYLQQSDPTVSLMPTQQPSSSQPQSMQDYVQQYLQQQSVQGVGSP